MNGFREKKYLCACSTRCAPSSLLQHAQAKVSTCHLPTLWSNVPFRLLCRMESYVLYPPPPLHKKRGAHETEHTTMKIATCSLSQVPFVLIGRHNPKEP